MPTVSRTLYDILEVARIASRDVIDASYERLREKLDPETPGNPKDDAARLRFNALREAYITLSNPERRKQYDSRLRSLEWVEVVEPFWTPTRAVVLITVLALAGTSYWRYQSSQAAAEIVRITAEKEKAAKLEAEKQRREEEMAQRAQEQRRTAELRHQQSELERTRLYADQLSRSNNIERERYERQLQSDRQREEQARLRDRQLAEADARRQAAEDQRKLRELQYERLRGR